MKTELYKFEPMLGPYDKWPKGSPERAERLSNRLQLATRSVTRSTAHNLVDQLKIIMEEKPWLIWPTPPYNTPNDYCEKVTGYSWVGLLSAVTELIEDRDLELAMQTELAKAQVEHRKRGRPRKNPYNIRKLSTKSGDGGTGIPYLLRRIWREDKDVFARYEAGEFKSVRAAAIAAGIIKTTDLDKIKRKIENLPVDQLRDLRNYIDKKL